MTAYGHVLCMWCLKTVIETRMNTRVFNVKVLNKHLHRLFIGISCLKHIAGYEWRVSAVKDSAPTKTVSQK